MYKQQKRLYRRSINKRGFMLTNEVILYFIVIAIILASVIAITLTVFNRARVSVVQSQLNSFSEGIETCMIENPRLQIDAGQTYDDSTGLYSTLDETVSEKYIELINEYFDEGSKFDATTGRSVLVDPWKNPYELFVTTTDLDRADDDTITTISTGSSDTELRIIIKSLGTNSKMARGGSTGSDNIGITASTTALDDDDLISVTQMINGEIKSGTYGFKVNRAVPLFVNDTDGNRLLDEIYIK